MERNAECGCVSYSDRILDNWSNFHAGWQTMHSYNFFVC